MNDIIIVYITSPSTYAQELVHHLLTQNLIACATIIPASSMYWWQGSLVQESESIVIAKTDKSIWDRLQRAILEVHPYDIPCIITFPALTTKEYSDFITHAVNK